jgi:predicted nucleic acid-binding protein
MLVETDVLLGALNSDDPVNPFALKALAGDSSLLSPYSLLEVNLLARAGKMEILDHAGFAENMAALLGTYSVRILADKPQYHPVARRFESLFELTFFDSLHAAVSKVEGEILASFDRKYDKLGNEGVKRVSPRDL